MRSNETEKYKFNNNVHIAVIGKCGGCYDCANVCEENAVKEWMPPTVLDSLCTRCMKCVEACPRNVMQIVH